MNNFKDYKDSIYVLLNVYNDDLFTYRKRLKEASRTLTDAQNLSNIISLERNIKAFLENIEEIKMNITLKEENDELLYDLPEISKIDSEFLSIRKSYIELLSKIN